MIQNLKFRSFLLKTDQYLVLPSRNYISELKDIDLCYIYINCFFYNIEYLSQKHVYNTLTIISHSETGCSKVWFYHGIYHKMTSFVDTKIVIQHKTFSIKCTLSLFYDFWYRSRLARRSIWLELSWFLQTVSVIWISNQWSVNNHIHTRKRE